MRKLLLAASIVAAITGTAAASCDPGEVKIRFSHVVSPSGHPKGDAAAALSARVNAELNGRACMEVFPNSTLFSDDDVLDALVQGTAEMAAPSLSKFEKYTLQFRIFDLPFLFEDIAAVERFQQSQTGQRMLTAMTGKGLLGLTYWHNGMKQLSANRPLRMPADAAGLTFRIQSSDVLQAQFEALGATPVKLAFKDVAAALQDGRADGQENTWSNIHTKGFYKYQDGVTETNHGIIDYLVVTSAKFWRGLDPALRRDLQQILVEVTHEYNRFSFEINEMAKMQVLEDGGRVVRLRRDERTAWEEALSPVWARFGDQIGRDLIEQARNGNGS